MTTLLLSLRYGLTIALVLLYSSATLAAEAIQLVPTAKVEEPSPIRAATWIVDDGILSAEVDIDGDLVLLEGIKRKDHTASLGTTTGRRIVAEAFCLTPDCERAIVDIAMEKNGQVHRRQFAESKAPALDEDETGELVGSPALESTLARLLNRPPTSLQSIGPWLDLEGGGIAEGPAQGVNPDFGKLTNASEIPLESPGLKRLSRKTDHTSWGTGHMISLLTNAGAFVAPSGDTLHIGAVAQHEGGQFHGHKSHQNGLDADVLFVGAQKYKSVLDENGNVTAEFDRQKNWDLWRALTSQRIMQDGKETPVVAMILVSPPIKQALCAWVADQGMLADPANVDLLKRIRPTEGHDAHFHVRLHCSPHHPLCRKVWDPGRASETGC